MFGVLIRKNALFCSIDVEYVNSFCFDTPFKLIKLKEAWYFGEVVNSCCPKWAFPEYGCDNPETKSLILSWIEDKNEEPRKAALKVTKTSWKESGHLYTKAHQMNQLCILLKTQGKFGNWKFV